MTAVRCSDVEAAAAAVDDLISAGSTDLAALGELLASITEQKRRLTSAQETLEAHIAEVMPRRQVQAGPWRIERYGGGQKKGWKSEDLLGELAARTAVNENGELRSENEARRLLIEALRDCVPFTGSLGWRSRGLRQWGIDPDEYCETTPGRPQVQVHPVTPADGGTNG